MLREFMIAEPDRVQGKVEGGCEEVIWFTVLKGRQESATCEGLGKGSILGSGNGLWEGPEKQKHVNIKKPGSWLGSKEQRVTRCEGLFCLKIYIFKRTVWTRRDKRGHREPWKRLLQWSH